jgi:putative endonuclease
VNKAVSTCVRGRSGEEAAALFLQKKGMSILEKNYRAKTGEIDLIGMEGGTLFFIEVKAWAGGAAGLEYGINAKKQRRIIETAKYYLFTHRQYNDRPIRFDVVHLSPREGALVRYESAFMENV